MSYSINPSVWGNMCALPADITDKYLKLANGTQIKTALWIFRHSTEPIDPAAIAKKVGDSQANVEEALRYWASVGILNSEAPEIKQIRLTEPQAAPKQLPDLPTSKPTYEQIKLRCKESPELELLLNELQQKLGKTIGYDGQSTFLMMYDSYGLPYEVIFMLVDYCVSVGKTSFNYMAKLAKNWGEREIDTIEKADEAISNLNICQQVWSKFCFMTGIQNPKPTARQSQYLLTWVNDYKFSIDMIYLAYEEMANNCTKTSFAYINAVLTDWYQKGYKTPQDVEKAKTKKPLKKAAKRQPTDSGGSYDMTEFERRADKLPVYKRRKGESQ